MTDKIPKLEFAELPATIADALRPKYERLGYLGEFFARTAHQEHALRAFIEFTEASKGALDPRIVELIALTVSVMKDVAYERNQHERLSVNLGFGREWVEQVELLAPESAQISGLECTVQRFVIDAVDADGRDVTKRLNAVVDSLGYENAVAVMMVMARYTAHALTGELFAYRTARAVDLCRRLHGQTDFEGLAMNRPDVLIVDGNAASQCNPEKLKPAHDWPPVLITRARIDREIERLADLPRPANGRRSALFVHPNAPTPGRGLTPGVQVSLDVLKPGEETVPRTAQLDASELLHSRQWRHVRRRRRIAFDQYDVWNHPSYATYRHVNDSKGLHARLTYSNAALLEMMRVHLVEEDPAARAARCATTNPHKTMQLPTLSDRRRRRCADALRNIDQSAGRRIARAALAVACGKSAISTNSKRSAANTSADACICSTTRKLNASTAPPRTSSPR